MCLYNLVWQTREILLNTNKTSNTELRMSYGRPGPQLCVPSNPLATAFTHPGWRGLEESHALPKYEKALYYTEIITLAFGNTSVCRRLYIKMETCVQFINFVFWLEQPKVYTSMLSSTHKYVTDQIVYTLLGKQAWISVMRVWYRLHTSPADSVWSGWHLYQKTCDRMRGEMKRLFRILRGRAHQLLQADKRLASVLP